MLARMSSVGLLSEPRSDDEGGGGATASRSSGCEVKKAKTDPPSSLDLSSTSHFGIPVMLITANVGSIFDDPQDLIPQWLSQVTNQIKAHSPLLVAIHCQEVGGKNFEQSMVHVDDFVSRLTENGREMGYDRTAAFLDENFAASDKFTALGSIYFLHESLKHVEIYDFQERHFSAMKDHHVHMGNIDDVPLVEKHKFPLQFFPDSRWSRKGYLRTRWRFNKGSSSKESSIIDLVNIHLFHDASNLKSVETVPSIYVNYRRRALQHTLDRINNVSAGEDNNSLHPTVPYFIFGDFNFRLDGRGVVKTLASDLNVSEREKTSEDGGDGEEESKQFVDSHSQELVLSIGKKEFALLPDNVHDNTFSGEWRKWTSYDRETNGLQERLTEFPLAFPPTYPYEENPREGKMYMRTRCPAWCDRVLMSHEAKSLVLNQDNDNSKVSYGVIGREVCMGDHKPVFLKFELGKKVGQDNAKEDCEAVVVVDSELKKPRVESPSYTDLLSSPVTCCNNSTLFLEIKDASKVKLFKETTV